MEESIYLNRLTKKSEIKNNSNTQIVYILLFFLNVSILLSQNSTEIQRMRGEIKKLSNNEAPERLNENNNNDFELLSNPREVEIYSPFQNDISNNAIKNEYGQHFGYDFFVKRDTTSFWENLPPPKNYILGFGDEIVLSLWGETQLRKSYTISRDGKIYDDKVGLLNLSGKSLIEAKNYLKSQFGRVFATLNGKSPSTFIDVSLGQLGLINVNFVGQVKSPGIYPVHPFSNLITGLIQAGGVDTSGTLREILIKRDNGDELLVDLYEYFISGKANSNIQLRDNDIIIIKPRLSFIYIDSAVVNPGIYESTENDKIYDMIKYAGGLKFNSSKIIGLRRIRPFDHRSFNTVFEAFYTSLEETKSISALPGDEIIAQYLFDEEQKVEIIGQVKMTGEYHFYDGMLLSRLLELSSGFEDSTFWKSVYPHKAQIIRRMPDLPYEKVITFNLEDVFLNKNDFLLQNLDKIVVHANSNYFEKENIQLLGEVHVPGSYPLIKDNETLESILKRANNLTPNALENGISIFRYKKFLQQSNMFDENINENPNSNMMNINSLNDEGRLRVAWKDYGVILMPGDSIVVRESQRTINVGGNVYNPGFIEFKKGENVKYYIDSAGGYKSSADKKGIIVIYANGVVSPYRWYKSPKVEDGCTIYVNEKPNLEPFNLTEFASNWTSILSSLITVVILSRQI